MRYGTQRYGTVRRGTVWSGTVRHGTVRYGSRLSLGHVFVNGRVCRSCVPGICWGIRKRCQQTPLMSNTIVGSIQIELHFQLVKQQFELLPIQVIEIDDFALVLL
jgi:hypothetical protein